MVRCCRAACREEADTGLMYCPAHHPKASGWIASPPPFSHYWRLQKLYFISAAASLPVATVGALLIERYGNTDRMFYGTIIVGVVVAQFAWRWADKRLGVTPSGSSSRRIK